MDDPLEKVSSNQRAVSANKGSINRSVFRGGFLFVLLLVNSILVPGVEVDKGCWDSNQIKSNPLHFL